MYDIKITSENESHVKIDCSEGIARELHDKFSFRPTGYQYKKEFKAGIWNGWIHLFDRRSYTFPKGLTPELIDWADGVGYKTKITRDGFEHFFEEIEYKLPYPLPFEPHDYQEEAVKRVLLKKRQIILSPTASGKSFIIYLLARMLEEKRILILTPTVNLVTQLFGDFETYSALNGWDVDSNCHMIYSGQEKDPNKRIVISTWQSIYKLPKSYFSKFDVVICDEVHTATAECIKSILNKSVNAKMRVGLTGSLSDCNTDEMVLKGLFGPVNRMTTTKELMDRGTVSNLIVKPILLKHDRLPKMPFQAEMDYLIGLKRRNEFIVKLTKMAKGNTLVLFRFVDKHGKVLEKMMRDAGLDVHFVYSGTDVTDRDNVKKIMESRDGVVVLASEKLFSTGISINRLHNVVLSSSIKSKITIIQSIGRTLRKHDEKEIATIYDIGDDLSGGSSDKNHTFRHFIGRLKLYKTEQFEVSYMEFKL